MGRAVVGITVVCALAVVAVFAGTYAAAVAPRPPTISRDDAVAAALRQLPHNGIGFGVVNAQLEPDSTHFRYTGANGSGFSQDGVTQCLILPPTPFRFACRKYPVWVVELQGPSCQATIAINGYSGRFGGAGTDGCDIVPNDLPAPWFSASWE